MGKWINWTPKELTWIEKNRKMERAKTFKLFSKKFERNNITFIAYKALCKRNGWKTGRNGCFPKGHVPDNKGKKMPFNANSAKTQFKKGGLPFNKKPIGYEMVNRYGYVNRKINDLPGGNAFRAVHIIRWEELNGPIPEGHCLKCLSDDKTNTDPENWELIPRAILLRLNGKWAVPYDSAPDELKPAILATAKLQYMAKKITS